MWRSIKRERERERGKREREERYSSYTEPGKKAAIRRDKKIKTTPTSLISPQHSSTNENRSNGNHPARERERERERKTERKKGETST